MDIDEDGLHAEFRSSEMLLVSGCMLEFFFLISGINLLF